MQVVLGIAAVAMFLGLISSLWQHTAAVAAATTAQDFAYGFVNSEVGKPAISLGWAALATNVIAMINTIAYFHFITLLERLVDE